MNRRIVSIGRGLPVECDGDVNVERFAKTFLRVWDALPAGWRRGLRWHWNRPRKNRGVKIRLREKLWRQHDDDAHGGRRAHSYTHGGDTFTFWDGLYRRMPTRTAAGIIAHELGHAAQVVVGMDFVSAMEQERQADAIANAWGFDTDSPREWLEWHVDRWRDGVPIFRGEAG